MKTQGNQTYDERIRERLAREDVRFAEWLRLRPEWDERVKHDPELYRGLRSAFLCGVRCGTEEVRLHGG